VSDAPKRNEADGIDALLRDSLESAPLPELTSSFTERVTERVRPRRLSPEAGGRLRLFAFGAVGFSLALMVGLGVPWWIVLVALALPAALGFGLRRYF
jgi:hypothetical protein